MKKLAASVLAVLFASVTQTGLSDDFVNPYADCGVSAAVSNQVKNLTWCSLGTSITDFDDNPIVGREHGYQYYTMQLLDWSHDLKLVNAGRSGTLVSSSSSKPPENPCDIYTIEFGVNDWGTGHPVGTLDDYKNYLYNGKAVRWNNFASCYRNLIEMVRKVNPKAIIVLITPRKAYGSSTDAGTKMFPANCDDPTLAGSVGDYYDPSQGINVPGDQTHLKDYADLITAIGEYEGFPVVDWYTYAANQDNLASLSVDVAVHPNDAGYQIMAQMLAPKILEAVAAAGGGDGEGGEGDDPEEENPAIVPTDVVALRNVAVATAVGTAPTLPAKVAGLRADGTVCGEYAVVWPEVAAPSAEGITTVSGTAQVGGSSMSVTASVRAVAVSAGGSGGELVNIAPLAASMVVTTPGTTKWDNDLKDTSAIVNGWGAAMTIGGWNTPGNFWRIWTGSDVDLTVHVDFAWATEQMVSKIFVATYDDNQPGTLVLKDGRDGAELNPSSHTIDGGAYYKINQGDGHLYVFANPIPLTQLSIDAVKNTGGRWYGFYEIEIWAEEASAPKIEPLTADALSALAVDGSAVAGFAPTTYGYTVENGAAITSATSGDNMGITILPPSNGTAHVVTLAEDGESTKTYSVAMPTTCKHANTTVTGAKAATCTEPGSTGTTTCDDCGATIREAEVIPALGHDWGEWEVTKIATEEETGLRRRTCQREGCNAEENEVVPKVSHVVALRNVAGAVAAGSTYALPPTVKGFDAAGNALADVAVVWPSETVSYSEAGIYTVTGHAAANPALTVTATIRVEPVTITFVNVAPSATVATTDAQPNAGNNARLVSADLPADNNGVDWATANRQKGTLVNTLTWESEVTISKARVCYSGANNHFPPSSFAFSADASGSPTIDFTAGGVEEVGIHRWVEFAFATPIKLTTLRCSFGDPGNSRWLIVERVWAYESMGEAEVVPSSNAALGDLKVDGKTVIGFDPEVVSYTVYNGSEITSAVPAENASVTILPKDDSGVARVMTLSEDGLQSRVYTITMPVADIAALRNIAVIAAVGEDLSLPPTVMALAPTGGLIGELPVEWDAPRKYDQPGTYVVSGHAKDDPSLPVKASVRVVSVHVSYDNVSPSATPATSGKSSTLIDLVSAVAPGNLVWNTGNDRARTLTDTLTWNDAVAVYRARICYSSGHKLPQVVTFFDSDVGGSEIGYTKVSEEKGDVHTWIEYAFNRPVSLKTLRCVFDMGAEGQWLVVERIWVFAGKGGLDDLRSSNAKPSALKVNGMTVADFDPDVLTRKVGGRNVVLESDDNIGVTVLPEVDRVIRVVTLSEDGTATRTYEFNRRSGMTLVFQ